MINLGFLAIVLIYPIYFIVHKNPQVGGHGPLNISDLIKVEAQFFGQGLFCTLFLILHQRHFKIWFDFNSKGIWIEFGIVLIHHDQGPWSHCFQQ